jgi:hypothetical protein
MTGLNVFQPRILAIYMVCQDNVYAYGAVSLPDGQWAACCYFVSTPSVYKYFLTK